MSERLGGGGDGPLYTWEDIKKDKNNETPNLKNFGGGDPYPDEEISRDLQKIAKIKSREDYRESIGTISDSEIQEYATAQELGEMDWFGEDARYDELFPDGKGSNTCAFLTSEFDDHINHVDMVCLMNNSCSDFETVPFAIDLTYNPTDQGLDKKFGWECHSRDINVGGFCTVKYFQDTFNDPPLLSKGRIAVLPRFVVGFSEELSTKITKERMTSSGWSSLSREEPSNKAKFCALKELKQQSAQMLEWLKTQQADNPTIAKMTKNVTALDEYFAGALAAAKQNDPHDFEKHSNDDAVANGIMARNIVTGRLT